MLIKSESKKWFVLQAFCYIPTCQVLPLYIREGGWGVHGVMVTVVGNGHSNSSSILDKVFLFALSIAIIPSEKVRSQLFSL